MSWTNGIQPRFQCSIPSPLLLGTHGGEDAWHPFTMILDNNRRNYNNLSKFNLFYFMLIFYSASLPQFYSFFLFFFLINVIFWGARGKVTTREVGPIETVPRHPPFALFPFSQRQPNANFHFSLSNIFLSLFSQKREAAHCWFKIRL